MRDEEYVPGDLDESIYDSTTIMKLCDEDGFSVVQSNDDATGGFDYSTLEASLDNLQERR